MVVWQTLRGSALADGLTDAELGAMSGSLGRRTYGKGVFIFHKDSPGQVLYIIESGQVRLFIISDMGQEISLNVLGPGEIFGELAALDGRPRASGAVALETTVALTWQREDLLRSLEAYPRLGRNLMEALTARLRYATRSIEDLAFLDVNSRVAARLLDLAARSGVQRGDIEIELSLTQGELATWVAASRESVNKVLAAFRAGGLIALEGSRITILDGRRLEQQVRY
jgi:CRP/FNR family transcriptional regulator/CRP/FNR family cyclic AMP-dependent transcriptional regulator